MRGLPRNIKIELLEHDPVLDLPKMLSFVQRYQAIQDYISDSCNATTASNNDGNPGSTSNANASSELTRLVALVSDMAVKQQQVDSKINHLKQSERSDVIKWCKTIDNDQVAILLVMPVENQDTLQGTARMLLVGHQGQTTRT